MRRRITRALVAAAAAGATITTLGFAATGAASAAVAGRAQLSQANGPLIANTQAAGYEASGRDFRYISALVTVPNIPFSSPYFAQQYIQLSSGSLASGDQETRAGIEPCSVAENQAKNNTLCNGGPWVGYIEAFNNSINGPYFTHFVPLNVQPGDGVGLSIYFDQPGNELHFVITPPTSEACSTGPNNECYFKTQAYGPLFDHAAALVDFTNSLGNPVSLPPWAESFRITQFLQGALTTYRGNRGSFVGPWVTSEVEATTNGLPYPQGHVVMSPSPLWSDGMVANNAVRSDDAFGVWART